jgi:hypothetical protein
VGTIYGQVVLPSPSGVDTFSLSIFGDFVAGNDAPTPLPPRPLFRNPFLSTFPYFVPCHLTALCCVLLAVCCLLSFPLLLLLCCVTEMDLCRLWL